MTVLLLLCFLSGCSMLMIDIPTEHGMIHLREVRPWGHRVTTAQYNPLTKQMSLAVDTEIEHIDPQVLGAAIGVALEVLKKSSGLP
jgi:hypothetical protein